MIDLNKRLDSLQTKIEEEQKQYARLDSAEKALDSVNIRMQELQKEKELLQWRVATNWKVFYHSSCWSRNV